MEDLDLIMDQESQTLSPSDIDSSGELEIEEETEEQTEEETEEEISSDDEEETEEDFYESFEDALSKLDMDIGELSAKVNSLSDDFLLFSDGDSAHWEDILQRIELLQESDLDVSESQDGTTIYYLENNFDDSEIKEIVTEISLSCDSIFQEMKTEHENQLFFNSVLIAIIGVIFGFYFVSDTLRKL